MVHEFICYLALTLFVCGIVLSFLSGLGSNKENSKTKRILTLLPGINCGQCGYPGCNAYADALSKGECACNLCKPAGADVAKQLATMLGSKLCSGDDYESELFSPRTVAYIHENKCNGCGKCKRKCPVDAITGILKQPHVVDADECIGCDECVKACPEECIEKIRLEHNLSHFDWNIHAVQIKNGNN